MAHFYIVKVLGVVSVTLTLALITNGQMDLTKQPDASGASVVSAVVDVIRHSCIFPDDKFFLRRLAYVESRDGVSARTYRPGYDGGIWQVERYQFNATQHSPALQKYFPQIQSLFGIDWTRVTWSDLRKPLYSGIASSLYTQTLDTSVPRGIEKQSMFWTHNYKSASTELSYNFTVASSLLSENCQGNQTIDLAFILDGSSSVSPEEFVRSKEFVLHVIDIFRISLDNARVSVITYSDDAVVEMYLGANQTKEEVREQILNIRWRGGSTATGKALDLAADVVFTAAHGSRVGASKAVILLSDGQSNDFHETKTAARRVREMGITVFAVGVGTILDLLELKEVASDPDCTHLFLVNSYDEIDSLVEEIQHASCRIPVVIGPTDVVKCELSKDNSCVYQTRNISAIQITVDCSTAILHSSYNNPYPGSAYYELTSLATAARPVILSVGTKGKPLYISVSGPQLDQGDGRRCFATLRPMKHEYTFELICRENGVDRECSIPADLFRYKPQICNDNWWDFTNPCTRSAVEQGQVVFPHPYNANMYLTCDLTGRVYIVICPSGTLFDQNSLQCGMGPRGNGTGHVDINPCTPDQLLAGNFFFPYLEDHHKYIHCDAWGHPWVMDCNGGFVWDQRELTCVEEFLVGVTPHPHYNPCTREMIAMGKLFFPYPDDNRHYIRCDAWGQAFVMPCEPGTVWNQQVSVCV